MLEPAAIVAVLKQVGFTHLVWIPDSHLGTWEAALMQSPLKPIRVTREGEAIGVAAGLMLGEAKPLVAIQCTGFFEAGDAVRNVAHDLKLPLKLIIGVRSARAARDGRSQDNCPLFAEQLVVAWKIPHQSFDPAEATSAQLEAVLEQLARTTNANAILWAE